MSARPPHQLVTDSTRMRMLAADEALMDLHEAERALLRAELQWEAGAYRAGPGTAVLDDLRALVQVRRVEYDGARQAARRAIRAERLA